MSNTPDAEKPAARASGKAETWWTVVMIVIAATVVRACNETHKVESPKPIVTVLIPTAMGQRVVNVPYQPVQVLKSSPGYIKFQTSDGSVMEYSGTYQIITSTPSSPSK